MMNSKKKVTITTKPTKKIVKPLNKPSNRTTVTKKPSTTGSVTVISAKSHKINNSTTNKSANKSTANKSITKSTNKNKLVKPSISKLSIFRNLKGGGGSSFNYKYGIDSKQGKRDYMEDTYNIQEFMLNSKKAILYGVFDGHGGDKVSKRLSDKDKGLFSYMISNLNKKKDISITNNIRNSFLEYDLMLYKENFKDGSTAIVILVYDDMLYVINLGDSRAMIISSDEKINIIGNKSCYMCSNDHKPWKDSEKKRIFLAGYFVSPFKIYPSLTSKKTYQSGDIVNADNNMKMYWGGKWESLTNQQANEINVINEKSDVHRVGNSLALSRSFGDFYLKKNTSGEYMGINAAVSPMPDIQIIKINYPINMILASDGFWDVYSNKNSSGLRNLIRQSTDLNKLANELTINSLSSGDNVTVMVVKLFK